jgi:hypothetical protein
MPIAQNRYVLDQNWRFTKTIYFFSSKILQWALRNRKNLLTPMIQTGYCSRSVTSACFVSGGKTSYRMFYVMTSKLHKKVFPGGKMTSNCTTGWRQMIAYFHVSTYVKNSNVFPRTKRTWVTLLLQVSIVSTGSLQSLKICRTGELAASMPSTNVALKW